MFAPDSSVIRSGFPPIVKMIAVLPVYHCSFYAGCQNRPQTHREEFCVMTYETLNDLIEKLPDAWSTESSNSWSAENPAKGQCSVTSLVVQDLFGGDILKTRTKGGTHFYNRIDGVRHDLTISQFAEPIQFDDSPASRDEAFSDTSPQQYAALRARLLRTG
jgi:hypothetical protein